MRTLTFASLVAMLAFMGQSKELYDHVKSDVAIYTKLNFEKQVTKSRDKGISIVHFYKDEPESKKLKKDYEAFATENKGIFRIGSMDCVEWKQFCEKEKVTSFPTVRIYPEFPAPILDADVKAFSSESLKKAAGKFYVDKSIEITNNNLKTFLEEDLATPKVLVFTNAKKGTPFVVKALSYNFEKTLRFGLVR